MIKRLAVIAVLCVGTHLVLAQHATAPNGYYPETFNGDTFRGTVASVYDSTESLTLHFEKGNKLQDFTGRIEQPCAIPTKNGQPMRASDIPLGTDITAYYLESKDKTTGQKQNLIIGIAFNSFNGNSIPEDKRKMYYCTGQAHVKFRAYQ